MTLSHKKRINLHLLTLYYLITFFNAFISVILQNNVVDTLPRDKYTLF